MVGRSPGRLRGGETGAVDARSITPFTSNLGYNGEARIAPDNQTIAYVSDRAAVTRSSSDRSEPARISH